MELRRIRWNRTLSSLYRKTAILSLFVLVVLHIGYFSLQQTNIDEFRTIQWQTIPSYIANIPQHIIQTSKNSSDVDVATNSFIRLNPTYKYFHYNDSAADEFVHRTMPDYIYRAYTSLPKPILKADYFRYIVLLVKGGIYTDMDTVCLLPINTWMKDFSTNDMGLIIGIEADVSLWDVWQGDYVRQIQFVQWTIAVAPGHPILHQIVQKIADISSDIARKSISVENVLEWTGPGAWTDVIAAYFWVKYRFRWQSLRNLQRPQLVGDDIYVLPITAFSPGLKRSNSKPITDPEARVEHSFAGSWKNLNKS